MIKSRAGFSLVEKWSRMVSCTAHPWNTMWLERVLGYLGGWLVVLYLSSLSAKVVERRCLIWFWRRKRLFRMTYCKRKIFRWETCLWEGWKLWVAAKQKLDAWKCCVNQSERCEREEGRKLRPESEEMCRRPLNREMWWDRGEVIGWYFFCSEITQVNLIPLYRSKVVNGALYQKALCTGTWSVAQMKYNCLAKTWVPQTSHLLFGTVKFYTKKYV